jgi:hypothetical protein
MTAVANYQLIGSSVCIQLGPILAVNYFREKVKSVYKHIAMRTGTALVRNRNKWAASFPRKNPRREDGRRLCGFLSWFE